MPDPDLDQSLQTSQDPKLVRDAACALARSSDAAQQRKLLTLLKTPEFLGRMDGADAYRGSPWALGIRRVLDDLAANPAQGHPTLVALTADPVFTKESARVDLLIMACAKVRPAPPQVVKFWDNRWQPGDGYTHITIDAVTLNGSEPAVQLLGAKLGDVRFTEEDRMNWMRASILIHRNDAPLLKVCDTFLRGGASTGLKTALLEVLFDYQPTVWFPPATVRRPPERLPMSKESAVALTAIGQYALDTLNPGLLEPQIKATLKMVEPLTK